MEIAPQHAGIEQILEHDGGWITVTDDVQNVANDLAAIDHHLRLRFSKAGGYFVVYWKPDDGDLGDGYMVTTAVELDQRIVAEVREIYHRVNNDPNYSFADELERKDAKARKAEESAFSEKHGEMYERLAFAMRKDLGVNQSRIHVPSDVE